MADPTAATYRDLVDVLDDLPVALRSVRRARRLSQRAAAAQAGVPFSTISRVENGAECTTPSLRALLLWLDGSPPDAPSICGYRDTDLNSGRALVCVLPAGHPPVSHGFDFAPTEEPTDV